MRNPYGAALERCELPREAEARLLREVSRRMEECQTGTDFVALVHAISWNRRVWEAFARELAQEGNALAPELRASLLSIAGAVDRGCSRALAGERDAIPALVEINRNIAAGLG